MLEIAVDIQRGLRVFLMAMAGLALAAAGPAFAIDKIVLAVNKFPSAGPFYIALAKGFFAEERLDVSLLQSTSAQVSGLAVASGDAPIGFIAFTAGNYTIAGKGAMKIVAGGYEEKTGFKGIAILVSRAVYERGVRKPADLVRMKVGASQIGSPQEHMWARLAKKHGFKYSDLNVVALQSVPNIVSALRGGQVDAAALPANLALQLDQGGEAKIITWMSDEVPGQIGGVVVNASVLNRNPALVHRFLRAYIKAIAYYDRAFQRRGPDGQPLHPDAYREALKIVSDRLEEPAARVALGLPYFNPDPAIKTADLEEHIGVWISLKQIDPAINAAKLIDTRPLVAARSSPRP